MTPSLWKGSLPSLADLDALRPALAGAARSVHADWMQDAEGFDPELGTGGICQDVASAMQDVLVNGGFGHCLQVHSTVGENHVFLVVLHEGGVATVDVPPSVYETGSGFVWKKRQDAVFGPDCVVVDRIEGPLSPEEFEARYSD